MKFRSRVVSATILILIASSALQAQAPQGKTLSFDVATIKPAAPLDTAQMAADMKAGRMPKVGQEIDATRATYTYEPLDQLIALAYNLRAYQISGPPWLTQERFDIVATIPEGATKDDVPAMLRSLLVERFKLVAHQSQEEQKVLALMVGKTGIKMKESATAPQAFDPNSPLAPGERQVDDVDGPMRVKMNTDGTITANMGARGTIIEKVDRQSMTFDITSSGVTMGGFAQLLSTLLMQMGGANSRQVIDMTGLKGYYEVDVEISIADLMAMARAQNLPMPAAPSSGGGASTVPEASDPGGGSSVFDSIRQMGLKLDDSKATVNRLVIDHIEKTPTEN
jgi:uncharacterized protein (TIGR03435 family)